MKKFVFVIITFLLLISCKAAEVKNISKDYYNSTGEKSKVLEKEFLSELIITTDKFQQAKFYKFNTTEFGLWGYKNHPILLYGTSDINNDYPLFLRLKLRYLGSGWIFFDKITFLYDAGKKTYNIDLSDYNSERNTFGGVVTEEYDISLNNDQILKIEEIMKSEKVEYRLSGKRSFESYIYKEDQDLILALIKLYKTNNENAINKFIKNGIENSELDEKSKDLLKESLK